MAIVRTAGTEIIRSALFEDIDASTTDLIIGVQHHIYTVLSITIYAHAMNATTDTCNFYIQGYDSKGGTTAQNIIICKASVGAVGSTFVWNDKFSFNGYEPVDFTGPMDDATKQDAIADQANTGNVAQKLRADASHADDSFEVTITYIDQNNA